MTGPKGATRGSKTTCPQGTYLLEATTYGDREHGHELTEFTLTIEIVDEDVYKINAEDIYIPESVVVGQPVTVHYRVGNAGRTSPKRTVRRCRYMDRECTGHRRAFWRRMAIGRREISHHYGEPTAISASVTHRDVKPFTVTFNRPGDNWAFVAIVTNDEGEEAEEEDFPRLLRRIFGAERFRV